MMSSTKPARTGDAPAEHVSFEWVEPEGSNPLRSAREAVDALFAVAEGWIDVLGLELRLACHDHEVDVQVVDVDPPRPFHLLVREPRVAEVRITTTYRAMETRLAAVDRAT